MIPGREPLANIRVVEKIRIGSRFPIAPGPSLLAVPLQVYNLVSRAEIWMEFETPHLPYETIPGTAATHSG